ncbi:MAG: hypothetical protein JW827_04180 [Spirochaetes bacterium]|nr:hypothetical protein [Spirochaetota bacterium]
MFFIFFLLISVSSILYSQEVIRTTVEHSYVEVDFSQFSGHTITVDTQYSDWVGTAPTVDNTGVYNANEFIYKDAWRDDTGDGDYAYPWNQRFKQGMADIVEFRVTYDASNLYFYVEMLDASPDADGWWVNGVLIGISDQSTPDGNNYLIQGDGVDPDKGPAAEINTKYRIQYTIFAEATYRIRMWNYYGIKIGDGQDPYNEDGSISNLQVKAKEWNKYEIAVPQSLIGTVTNKKIKFLVASCFQEAQMVREVQGYPLSTEWNITGGDRQWGVNTGPDPDVMDLIGASSEKQAQDLAGYRDIFFNSEFDFEVFNFDLKPYIFSPSIGETTTIYFTAATQLSVTLNIRDLNGEMLKTLLNEYPITLPTGANQYWEIKWDGADKRNNILKRGAYIVEAIFKRNKQEKIVRKVVRIW